MFGLNLSAQRKPELDGEFITARLNARVQPLDRGEHYEDPLHEAIAASGMGEVTGGVTNFADDFQGVDSCDLEILVANTSDETLTTIKQRLEALGAPKGSSILVESENREIPIGVHEGLGVYLNGVDLDEEVYAECDVNVVISEFETLLGEAGAFRSHWEGPRETALFCYGPSFEEMKTAITPFLEAYPLCKNARVEQIA